MPQGLGYTLVSTDLELCDKSKHGSTSWLLCWFSCLVSWAMANLHGKISGLLQAQHGQLKKHCAGTLTEARGEWFFFLPWARYWLISLSLLRPGPCPTSSWLLPFSASAARKKRVSVIITGRGEKTLSVPQIMWMLEKLSFPSQGCQGECVASEWKFWKFPFFILWGKIKKSKCFLPVFRFMWL